MRVNSEIIEEALCAKVLSLESELNDRDMELTKYNCHFCGITKILVKEIGVNEFKKRLYDGEVSSFDEDDIKEIIDYLDDAYD